MTESKKLNTKSPMAKGMSPTSTKSKKSTQIGQLNMIKIKEKKQLSSNPQCKVSVKKKYLKPGQQPPTDPKKQRPSIFDANTPILDPK